VSLLDELRAFGQLSVPSSTLELRAAPGGCRGVIQGGDTFGHQISGRAVVCSRRSRSLRAREPRPLNAEDGVDLTTKLLVAQKGYTQALGDPHGGPVLRVDNRYEPRNLEHSPSPSHGGIGRLGGVSVTPSVARECPANLNTGPPRGLGAPQTGSTQEPNVGDAHDRPVTKATEVE
jgi:hypothetical protein